MGWMKLACLRWALIRQRDAVVLTAQNRERGKSHAPTEWLSKIFKGARWLEDDSRDKPKDFLSAGSIHLESRSLRRKKRRLGFAIRVVHPNRLFDALCNVFKANSKVRRSMPGAKEYGKSSSRNRSLGRGCRSCQTAALSDPAYWRRSSSQLAYAESG
jgi:hypothetical protein